MNPVLRKLSRPALPRLEIARLLEQHVGPSFNPLHCEAALTALRRIRDPKTNAGTRVLARISGTQAAPCDTIKQVIEMLKNGAWDDD